MSKADVVLKPIGGFIKKFARSAFKMGETVEVNGVKKVVGQGTVNRILRSDIIAKPAKIAGWGGVGYVGANTVGSYIKDNGGLAPIVGKEAADIMFGRGTYDKSVDTVKDVVDKSKEVVSSASDTVAKASEAMQKAFNGQQSGVTDYNGGYNTGGYVGTGNGSFLDNALSPFAAFKNIMLSMLNGNGNTLGMAAMLPAAYLMFGHFGWMGKIVSLLLGGTAATGLAKKISTPSQQLQQQQSYRYPDSNIREFKPLPAVMTTDDNVVTRSRKF